MYEAICDVLLLSLVVFVVAKILPGIRVKGFGTAVVVAIVYSVVHFLLFRILVFLSLPFLLFSFGLFVFIINAFLLWLTSQLVRGFEIRGLGTTLAGSLLITAFSIVLRALL